MHTDVRSDLVTAPATLARVSVRPLSVCHVISADLWAGAEVQVATTAAALVTHPGVKLRAVLFNEGALADRLRSLRVPTAVIDERRRGPFAMVRALTAYLAEHKVDVVHTHRHSDTVLGAVAAALAGVPHQVRTVHGLREPLRGWPRMKYSVYEALERFAGRARADAFVAVSRFVADDLERQGYPRDRVVCIHNGIDLDAVKAARSRAEVRASLGLDNGQLVIGTAGRLTAVKAQERLLHAARIIRRAEPRAAFLIVGDGPRRQALLDCAARLGLADACIFTGARSDAYDLVAAMDIFTLPSISEGTPMALLEAMALGVPLVATAVGGVPEVVEHRVHGLLVESGDDNALAAACLELSANAPLARGLASRARDRVETFSAARSGDALLGVYHRLAGTPGRTGIVTSVAPWCGAALMLGERAARRVTWRAELRRQRRDRVRNGLQMAAALRRARRVLVVCHGNIIRSAFAAHLLTRDVPAGARPSIVSAGLEALPGSPADSRALFQAGWCGVDLGGHRAARVDARAVADADVILAMDVPQLLALRERYPQARQRIFLFATLADDTPLEVRDPVLGDRAAFERCFDHIMRAAAPVVRVLSCRSLGA